MMRALDRRALWATMLAAAMAVALLSTVAEAGRDRFVRVKAKIANVRGGPGTSHKLLWRVARNFPVKVVGVKRRWLRTEDFVGDEGWIYRPLTDREPSAIVTVDLANVRSGPGTNHAVRFRAEYGTSFHIVGRSGQWLRVSHADGDEGWIHRRLVWGAIP